MATPDPILARKAELAGLIDAAFQRARHGPGSVLAELASLRMDYPGCAELALIDVIAGFYRGPEAAATNGMVALVNRRKELYHVGRLEQVTLAAVRRLVAGEVSHASWEYTRFVFCVNYFKQLMGDCSALLPWIEYERGKKTRSGNHDALFLLRNMTWGLLSGPLAESGLGPELRRRVDAMDEDIIRILRKKLPKSKGKPPAAVRRVAICAGLLKHSRRGMHARLVMDYARNLAETYPHVEILVLVTNELPFKSPFHSFSMERVSDSFRDSLEKLADRVIDPGLRKRVHFENMRQASGDWQDLEVPIRRVLEFDPDVVMHFGAKFHNESFFVRRILFDRFPTVYFFSQMTNKVDRFNDIYLARNSEPLRGDYDSSKVRIAPPPLRAEVIDTQSERQAFRYEVGHVKRKPEEVTLISVLAGPRMRNTFMGYDPQLRGRLMDLLDLPNTRWIWLGPENREALLAVDPRFRQRHEEGKLDIVAFDENLGAFYEHCDLFLHPPAFTGGAGGLFMAAMAGVPTLCFRDTDAAARVDGNCVFDVGDIDGFIGRAKALIQSADLRREVGLACQQHFHGVGVAELSRLTYSALNEALDKFRARTATHS